MIAKLKILILEDNQSDADLLQRELKKSGLIFTSEIVQARKEFEYALQNFNPDIILSDYSLPAFDAVTAFHIKQNISPIIPFIIVSGVIGDENAVELIKNGVTDYTPKDKLFTLSTKINRALKDAEARKEKTEIAVKLELKAAQLILANKALVIQNIEKEKQTKDLIVLTEALEAQKDELRRANEKLFEKAQLLKLQEEKLIGINEDLFQLNQDLETRVFDRTRELVNLNHELKDLNLSKDKFLSVISHDLRNPIAAMMMSSDKLSRDIEKSIFIRALPMAKIIYRTSHKILNQLNEVVEWARVQADKSSINSEKLDLLEGVNQSLELLRANARHKNIGLENNVSLDVLVFADKLMLRSILQNLVTNAIKYTPLGGLVSVTSQRINKMVEVCIKDSGIGMEAAMLKNLFTKSDIISRTGTNNETGSGLGLILVKDFVTQHGGTIRAEGKIGKGTSIIFSVPEYLA